MAEIKWKQPHTKHGNLLWAEFSDRNSDNALHVHIAAQTIVKYTGHYDSLEVVAGPFDTLDEAKAVYLLMERLNG